MRIKQLRWLGLLWMMVLLVGCDGLGSIPADKQAYIGTWYGQYMELTITPEARVEYQYNKGGVSKSLSAPIKEFIGNDFKAGALGINSVFVVSTPPYQEDGVWKMIVDDQLVVRRDAQNIL